MAPTSTTFASKINLQFNENKIGKNSLQQISSVRRGLKSIRTVENKGIEKLRKKEFKKPFETFNLSREQSQILYGLKPSQVKREPRSGLYAHIITNSPRKRLDSLQLATGPTSRPGTMSNSTRREKLLRKDNNSNKRL